MDNFYKHVHIHIYVCISEGMFLKYENYYNCHVLCIVKIIMSLYIFVGAAFTLLVTVEELTKTLFIYTWNVRLRKHLNTFDHMENSNGIMGSLLCLVHYINMLSFSGSFVSGIFIKIQKKKKNVTKLS